MRMKVLLGWLGYNSEALIALVTAVVVGVLGLIGAVPNAVVNGAILVTLAALSLSVLRDRWNIVSEPDARATLLAAGSSLSQLPVHLERLRSIDSVLSDTRLALDENSMIRVLVGDEISHSLADARADAKEWVFKGGTATFVRAVVIPDCVRRARLTHRVLNIRMEILDPTNIGLCERYTRYFQHVVVDPNEDEKSWTVRGTQIELYATILSACWWKQHYPPLDIRIALSSTMTTFRWDMTQDRLIITERGPRFPAMMIREGRFYHDYWRNELRESFEQARRLPLQNAATLSDRPTVEGVRDLFAALDVHLSDDYSDDDVAEIIRQAIDAKNPYS